MYTAPWAGAVAAPADTIIWGTAWGATWVESGLLSGGVRINSELTRGEVRVDQLLEPVVRPATGRSTTFETRVAELRASSIKDAVGQGSVTTVAPTTGVRGHDDWDLTDVVSNAFISAGLDALHSGDNEAIRAIVWKSQPVAGMSLAFTSEDLAGITFQVAAFPDTSVNPARIMKIRDVIAAT